MGVPVLDVLFTVFQSIFQVFLLCLAGFVLSYKGIVDKPSSKVLNHINVALFTPALLFSKVAYFLSPAKLRQLWVIPVFFAVVTALSAVIAHCLARACRLKRSQVNFATAASMFMNSNSLPVALMQSLATTVPLLKWGSEDTVDAMFGRSLTYLVVFSTLGMILRWSYGVRLLAQADEPEPIVSPPSAGYRDIDDHDQEPALVHVAADRSTVSLVGYETELDVDPREPRVWRPRARRSPSRLTRRSRPSPYPHGHHSHLPAVPTSLGDQSESDDEDDVDTTGGDSEDTIALRSDPVDTGFSTEAEDHAQARPSSSPSHPIPRWEQPPRPSLFVRVLNWFTSLSPPLVASLLALLCVLVPPVQHLLNSDDMIPVKGALDSAGACSIPLTMLVLGGWFWDGDSKPNPKHGNPEDDSNRQGNAKSQGKAKGKGKRVEKCCVPSPSGQADPPGPPSHASTTWLSSLINAFGNVFVNRIYPLCGTAVGSAWKKQRMSGSTTANDVEACPQVRTEAEIERADNGSQAREGAMGGCARSSLVSPSSSIPTPSAPARRKPPGETLTVIVTLLARMVLVPLVATPLLILVSHMGWGGEVFEDPVFIVSSMLLVSSPPALTLAQISQRAEPTTDPNAFSPFERLLSRTVFWAYLVLTPPLTIASVMVGLLYVESSS